MAQREELSHSLHFLPKSLFTWATNRSQIWNSKAQPLTVSLCTIVKGLTIVDAENAHRDQNYFLFPSAERFHGRGRYHIESDMENV